MMRRKARLTIEVWLTILALTGLWLVGCSRGAAADMPILDTRWYVLSVVDGTGEHEVPADPAPFLEVGEDYVLFDNGCNEIHANAEADEERFNVSMVTMRGTGCGERISKAALDMETFMGDVLATLTTYTIKGDELVAYFEGGEARFSRAVPPNAADLRAFPVQQRKPVKPSYGEDRLVRGRLIQEEGCLRFHIDTDEHSYALVWPNRYAVGFDEGGVTITDTGDETLLAVVGDELVLSGGRIEAIEPLIDGEFLFLSSVIPACEGPYWVMTDAMSL